MQYNLFLSELRIKNPKYIYVNNFLSLVNKYYLIIEICHSPASRSLIDIEVSQGDVNNPQKLIDSNEGAVQNGKNNLCHIALFRYLSAVATQNESGFLKQMVP